MEVESKPIQTTAQLFSGYTLSTKRTRRTERGDLLEQFLAELNPPRIQAGYKPLLISYISLKFSSVKMSTPEIYRFYQDCKRAKNFSTYFWFSFKVQKEN